MSGGFVHSPAGVGILDPSGTPVGDTDSPLVVSEADTRQVLVLMLAELQEMKLYLKHIAGA